MEVTIDVNPEKQQRRGGPGDCSTHSADLPSMISAPALTTTSVGSKSPRMDTDRLLSQELTIPTTAATAVAHIPTSDAAPDGDNPAITLLRPYISASTSYRRHDNSPVLVRAFALPHPTPTPQLN